MGDAVELCERDLTGVEEWREYDFEYLNSAGDVSHRVYRIALPAKLFYRVGGTTHRVVDQAGVAHCVPAPGFSGCVLRWLEKAGRSGVTY